MGKTEGLPPVSGLAAVIETLGSEQNVRVALLLPHTARKLVRESSDSDGTEILSSLSDSILVDMPFRNLLYDSRKVQRLYYELDAPEADLYPKSNNNSNSLLLLDPIRLAHQLKVDMNQVRGRNHLQAQRGLFMRCFSPRIWLIFLRLVSLGVGSRMRDLFAVRDKRLTSDYFLRDVEDFQLNLVELVLLVSNCDPRLHTPAEIEFAILTGCQNICEMAEQIRETWRSHLSETPLLSELIPYLHKCVSHVSDAVATSGSLAASVPGAASRAPARIRCEDHVPFPVDSRALGLDAFFEAEVLPPFEPGVDTPDEDDPRFPSNPSFYRIVHDLRRSIMAVATKSATLMSLVKLQVLERRHREFEVGLRHAQAPGAFAALSSVVLRKGFVTSGLEAADALMLMLLAHCLGAYPLREWALRFLVELKLEAIAPFIAPAAARSVNSYGFDESPYFRTAGQTVPTLGDFFTLVPPELTAYMRRLAAQKLRQPA